MTAAALPGAATPRRPRPWALAATLLLHAAVLLLVLFQRFEPAAPAPAAIPTVVDLIAEPEPPPPPPPPPPPEQAANRPAAAPSGAPRPARAPPATVPTAPLPESVDRTIPTPIPPLLSLPPVTIGTALTPQVGIVGPAISGNGEGGTGIGKATGNALGGRRAPGFRRAIWLHRPTSREIRPFWPAEALALKLSGKIMLACTVLRSGQPDRCDVLAETPDGYGFGAAAITMSKLFRVRPVTRGGVVVDVPVLIPVTLDYVP